MSAGEQRHGKGALRFALIERDSRVLDIPVEIEGEVELAP